MNFLAATLANNNTHWHPYLNGENVRIDNVSEELRAFAEGDNRDDVGDPPLEVRMIRFIEDHKGADRSLTGRRHPPQ